MIRKARTGMAGILSFALGALLLFGATPAGAQEWSIYISRPLQFTMNLPGEPNVEETTYTTEAGSHLPAHEFTYEHGTSFYKLTVVDFSDNYREENGAVDFAARQLLRLGEGLHNRYAYVDGLSGHDLSVTTPDGRRLLAVIYLYNHRLYIAEGSNVVDGLSPSRFTYSVILTHPDGTQLNLDGYNAESYNAFED